MAISVGDADTYFNDNVLHATEWSEADDSTKQKALNNAENQLYRYYKSYDKVDNPVDDIAVFEQALWLLRLDDSIRKAEQGVKQLSVNGITIAVDRAASYIAPEVTRILGRRIGWTVL